MTLRVLVPAGRTHRLLFAVRCLLLLVAALCIGSYVYWQVSQAVYQSEAGRAFDREATETQRPSRGVVHLRSSVLPLGRISIPRMSWSAIVDEGDDDPTLARAVGHAPNTAVPGDAGNVVLAGHRDAFFRSLRDLRLNDEIEFETANGDFSYHVESMTAVSPDYVEVMRPTAEDRLTLITCYPFTYIGSAPKRFVVRARRVGL